MSTSGRKDSSDIPTPDGADAVQLPRPPAGKEKYIRSALAVDGVSITFYRHEDLTPEQVIDRLVKRYRQWAIYRPGSRL